MKIRNILLFCIITLLIGIGIFYLSNVSIASPGWTTSYDTPATSIYSLISPSGFGAIFAGAEGAEEMYRCSFATGCDESSDWTSYDMTSDYYIRSLIYINWSSYYYLYAGSGDSDGIIYRCNFWSNCDAGSDWSVSYDTPKDGICSFAFDSANDVLYAGGCSEDYQHGDIYRCDTSTDCDASGDWTQVYDTSEYMIYSLLYDSNTAAIYAGSSISGIIYRCATSTGCDASSEWTVSYDTPELYIHSLTLDSTNNVIYAGTSAGEIYRCDTSTGCDASGDWTNYDITTDGEIYSLSFDSANGVIYAGSGDSYGIIYQCDISTSCDAASDWSVSYDTPQNSIYSLTFYSTNNNTYAGSGPGGIIYRYAPNVLPVASSVSIDSGAASVDLSEGTTTNVVCEATVTDDDGYADITSVEAKLYRTGVGAGAADDNANHYTLSGDSECVPSNGSGTTEDYTCTFAVYFYADPTDTGSAYESDNWTCKVTPSDGEGAGTADTDTIEMNTLTALDVTATIAYGELGLGNNTGTTDYTTTVTNTGNEQIDIQLDGYGASDGDGYSMTCTIGTITIGNERYSLSASTDWSSKTQLTDTATTLTSFDLAKGASSTKNVYWGFGMPSTGVGGSCSGKVNFTAVSG